MATTWMRGDDVLNPTDLSFQAKRRFDPATGCWLWTGSLNEKGYGYFWDRQNRKLVRAHRWAYERFIGPLAAGITVDHLCTHRDCVNPAHLEAVTHMVNVMRGDTVAARNAAKTHCPQGHAYDEANTYMWKGGRLCRACRQGKDKPPPKVHLTRDELLGLLQRAAAGESLESLMP